MSSTLGIRLEIWSYSDPMEFGAIVHIPRVRSKSLDLSTKGDRLMENKKNKIK